MWHRASLLVICYYENGNCFPSKKLHQKEKESLIVNLIYVNIRQEVTLDSLPIGQACYPGLRNKCGENVGFGLKRNYSGLSPANIWLHTATILDKISGLDNTISKW